MAGSADKKEITLSNVTQADVDRKRAENENLRAMIVDLQKREEEQRRQQQPLLDQVEHLRSLVPHRLLAGEDENLKEFLWKELATSITIPSLIVDIYENIDAEEKRLAGLRKATKRAAINHEQSRKELTVYFGIALADLGSDLTRYTDSEVRPLVLLTMDKAEEFVKEAKDPDVVREWAAMKSSIFGAMEEVIAEKKAGLGGKDVEEIKDNDSGEKEEGAEDDRSNESSD